MALPPAWLIRLHDVLCCTSPARTTRPRPWSGVGHAHARDESGPTGQALEQVADLRAAAVHHHGLMPTSLSSTMSSAKSWPQLCRFPWRYRRTDDHGLAMELADVRQRLRQDSSALSRCNGRKVWSVVMRPSGRDVKLRKLCRNRPPFRWRRTVSCIPAHSGPGQPALCTSASYPMTSQRRVLAASAYSRKVQRHQQSLSNSSNT